VIRTGDVLKLHVHTDEPGASSPGCAPSDVVTHKAEDMRAQARGGRALGPVAAQARAPAGLDRHRQRFATCRRRCCVAHGILRDAARPGGKTAACVRDGVDVSAEEFHARLARGDERLPTTSQPRPDFLETFTRAAADGESVGGVSSAPRSPERSSRAGPRPRASRTRRSSCRLARFSLVGGMLVLKAAELAEMGRSPAEIGAELRRVRAQSGHAVHRRRVRPLGRVRPRWAWARAARQRG
jgi:hypothetical protein